MPELAARPKLAVIAGPNGSGKSTFFDAYLRSEFPVFVNADEISEGLSGVPVPENVPIRDAPMDDEPESEEEARAVAASKE